MHVHEVNVTCRRTEKKNENIRHLLVLQSEWNDSDSDTVNVKISMYFSLITEKDAKEQIGFLQEIFALMSALREKNFEQRRIVQEILSNNEKSRLSFNLN